MTVALPTSSSRSRLRAEPRWETPRSPERDTFGHAIIAVAERLGKPLLPWQEQVALVGGELVEHESGLLVPAYRNVVFTVPRQNGKTLLVLAWEIQRALGWGEPQRIIYSAQTGTDAADKLIDDQFPILEPRKKLLGIKPAGLRKANGKAGVDWINGSKLRLLASTEDSGHGKTIDLAVKDELFADTDHRRDQTLKPAMITRRQAQVLVCSTAGTEDSVPWNETVAKGRAAVDAGARRDIAYFEWSAEPTADADDPDVWARCMPAMGYTIDEDVVRSERNGTMKDGEFRRAFLNIPTQAEDRLIPVGAWAAVQTTEHRYAAGDLLAFGIDVNPERSRGCIAAASVAARPVVELPPAGVQAGVAWIVPTAADIQAKHPRSVFSLDGTGPAASLVPDLERAGVRVRVLTAKEYVGACAHFYDAVTADSPRLWVRTRPELNDAVAGAVKRNVGDSWAWARKSAQVDVSPLVAATVAVDGARNGATESRPTFAY